MSKSLSSQKYSDSTFLALNNVFDFTLNVSNFQYRHMPVITGLSPSVDFGGHRVFVSPSEDLRDIDAWFQKLLKHRQPSCMLIPLKWLGYSSDSLRAFLSDGRPHGLRFFDAVHAAPGLLALGFNANQEEMLYK
jgi:hypothetical protein